MTTHEAWGPLLMTAVGPRLTPQPGRSGRVKRAARHDEVCLRMMTVPGVGSIAALTFKAAVDDPARFKSSRTVGAQFGLTPRRYQSGEHDNPGRISRAGDRDVRATLYAAANALADAHDGWVANQILGDAPDADQRPTSRCRRRRAKIGCSATPHVGRWHRVPSGKSGGQSMI